MGTNTSTSFAPHLQSKNVLAGMEYYKKAFAAAELRRVENPYGTVMLQKCLLTMRYFIFMKRWLVRSK